MDLIKTEETFCSAADAKAAGYRASKKNKKSRPKDGSCFYFTYT